MVGSVGVFGGFFYFVLVCVESVFNWVVCV